MRSKGKNEGCGCPPSLSETHRPPELKECVLALAIARFLAAGDPLPPFEQAALCSQRHRGL